jgi:hypothetical protein
MSFMMQIVPRLGPHHLMNTLTRFLQENPTLQSICTPDGQMIVPSDPTPDFSSVSKDTLLKLKFDYPASLQQRLHALSSTDEYKFRKGKQNRFLATTSVIQRCLISTFLTNVLPDYV